MTNEFQAIPVLASKAFDETISFFAKLGFETIYHDPSPTGYLILRNGDIEFHFFPYPDLDPTQNYCGTYIRGRNIDNLYAELSVENHVPIKSQGIPRAEAPTDKPWDMREFYIVDPSGNLLRFGQEL